MYYIIALITGMLISIMITANGGLAAEVGLYSSTILIHIVGLTIMTVVMIVKKVNPFKNMQPWYLYLGGVMGVIATVGNSYAFEPLGVSAILALGLLGQSIMGLIIDQFGLFGMKTYKLKPLRLIAFAVMLVGAVFMIRQVDLIAMLLSFSVGAALVLQRVINGNLAERTNTTVSTAYTYIIGLLGSILVLLVLGLKEPMIVDFSLPTNWLIYTGGAIGTVTVLLSMICVRKIPSYGLSVLIFIGQVFTGIIVDSILIGEIVVINLIGGIIITAGLCLDVLFSKILKSKG